MKPPLEPGAITGDALPPKPAYRSAQPVTESFTWRAGVTVSPDSLWPNQYTTITVTSNADVGPTPYYLRISYFDAQTQNWVYLATNYQPSAIGSNLVAFVAPFSTTLPPAGAQANSATVTTILVPPPR